MAKRARQDQQTHDKAVSLIAKERFPFPDEDHPTWETYINEPEQRRGVIIGGETLYPDIVVVDTEKNTVPKIGEVESQSTVTETERDQQWKKYAKVNDFFLYVPRGLCQQARQLARGLTIRGFGHYSWNTYGSFSLEDC